MSRCILNLARKKLRARIISNDPPEWLVRHPRASYIRNCVLASPDWVDRKAMRAIAAAADLLQKETGIPHVCDHIIPISHPMVCGLNVPWNIRVVSYAVNAAKSNAYHPDQLSLPL